MVDASGIPLGRLASRVARILIGKENPKYTSLSAALKATVRAQVKQEAQSDPDVQQAENRCEDEITRTEFECASKAKTAGEWNDCIN